MGDYFKYYQATGKSTPCPIAFPASILVCILVTVGCSEQMPANDRSADSPFPLSMLQQLPRANQNPGELEGRYLLVNFWATWCRPCRDEMPDLEQLSQRLDGNRYAVVGVSVDSDANLAREFLHQYRISFANYLDGEQQLATSRLGVEAFPTTFLVSPDGEILYRHTGIRSWDPQTLQELSSGSASHRNSDMSALTRGENG